MKKLKLILCCIPIFLCCGMYYSARPIIPSSRIAVARFAQASAGFWLYFRLEDRLAGSPSESAGRSKKGDLVQVRLVTPTNKPSVRSQQEWGIIKVDSISQEDIEKFTSSWEDTFKTARGDSIVGKAYRRWIFDVDSLSISKGLDTTKVPFAPIKTKSTQKTSAMLLEYKRKGRILKFQQIVTAPIRSIFNWAVRPLYAAESIKTVNKTGQDYDTIVLWEDAEDGAMTTGTDDVCEVYDDDGILKNSTRVDINGWTNNDATTKIIVRPATGEGHTGTDSTGFQRENTDATTQSILIQESYTIIKGLDLNGGGQTVSNGIVWLFNGSNITIERNLIWNTATSRRGIDIGSGTDDNFLIKNNVVYQIDGVGINVASSEIGELFNNTVYGSGNVGIQANYGGGNDSTTVSNNAAFENLEGFDFLDGASLWKNGSTNNISSDATADDGLMAEGLINKTDTDNFVDPAAPARNFKVKDTSADIYNTGADLVDFDNIGTSRPQSTSDDRGAFELIVAAPSAAAERRRLIITND